MRPTVLIQEIFVPGGREISSSYGMNRDPDTTVDAVPSGHIDL